MFNRRIFLLSLLIILAGCEFVPKRDRQEVGVEIPKRWVEDTRDENLRPSQWVKSFGDVQLNALVENALTNNYELKSAAARIAAAVAQARIDGSGRWPQVSFTLDHQQMQIREAGYGSPRFGLFEGMFAVSWEIDVWGRIRDLHQAAVLESQASQSDYYGARLSLAARVAQSYFELIEAQLLAEVVEQSIKDRSIVANLVRGRYQRGLVRGLDLRLALTDLATAQAELKQTRNLIQSITRRLEILLGRYPEGKTPYAAALPLLPTAIPAGLPAQILDRRPDLVAAFGRLQAADLLASSAKKLRLPRITLTAAGGTRSADLTDMIDPRAVAWNVFSGLMQPLFTGGRIQGEIMRNQAHAEEVFNAYKSTALNAFREVEQALAAEEWLREEEVSLRAAVEQTQSSQKMAVYSYRNGRIEILTLLDSYRSMLNAQTAHLSVTRQLLSNRVNLYLALGGSV